MDQYDDTALPPLLQAPDRSRARHLHHPQSRGGRYEKQEQHAPNDDRPVHRSPHSPFTVSPRVWCDVERACRAAPIRRGSRFPGNLLRLEHLPHALDAEARAGEYRLAPIL